MIKFIRSQVGGNARSGQSQGGADGAGKIAARRRIGAHQGLVGGLAALMVAGLAILPAAAASADTQASHFILTATSANTTGDAVFINNLATNDEPGALLYVSPNYDPGGVNGTYDNSPIGVYYDSGSNAWSVFNENGADIPAGASFNVLVEPAATADAFSVTASSSNSAGDTVFISSGATNSLPNDVLQATQVYNGALNAIAAGVYYDSSNSQWGVFNEGSAPMVAGTEYNVLVGPAAGGKTEVLKGNKTNIAAAGGSAVSLGGNATTTGDSNAFILDTPNWDPSGTCGCVYDTSQTGLSYFPSQWNVFNETEGVMKPKSDFNLLYWNS